MTAKSKQRPEFGGRSLHEPNGGGVGAPSWSKGAQTQLSSCGLLYQRVPSWPPDFWIPTLALLQILIRPRGDGEPRSWHNLWPPSQEPALQKAFLT